MKRIARSAIVGHPAGKMYALVQDIEAYPRFLPWCREAVVLESGEGFVIARLGVGLRGLSQQFTTRNDSRAPDEIRMRLVEGPFRHFAAAWTFRALSGDACAIEFALEYEFATRVVGKVLEPLFDHIADTMVDAFTRRADAVYGHAH